MDPDQVRQNLTALRRAEARRARTPGVRRWFVEISARESVPEELDDRRTATIRIPRVAFRR
jgi:hypothetical protein